MSFIKTDMKTDALRKLLLIIEVIFIVCLMLISLMFCQSDSLTIEQKIEYGTKALTTIAAIFGGIVLSINAYYTLKIAGGMDRSILAKFWLQKLVVKKNIQIEVSQKQPTQEQLISERFSKAIEQLGNEKIETRLGAIYALEKIAKDSPQDHWTIMEIFAAFIRENAPIIEEEEKDFWEDLSKISTDIQAALTVIGRRNFQQDLQNQKLDLRDINISGADLTGANFSGVDLTSANLQGVMFYAANLQSADLTGANLYGAILYEANLQKAIFHEAILQEAILRKANLQDAIFYEADLQGAMLYDANLSKAVFYEANLQGAILCDANLVEANFESSNLEGANFIGANLQKAILIGANLQGALLSTANLEEANFYEANLSHANLYEANLERANLIGAYLDQTIIEKANFCGADLTRTEHLQLQQIELAIGDRATILPENLQTPAHWQQEETSVSASEAET
jgi:uncharacterized protein YjbI with pentapeptide repeats